MLRNILRNSLRLTPWRIEINGPKRDQLLTFCDRFLWRRQGYYDLPYDATHLRLDLAQPNQRLMSYASHNLLRGYAATELHGCLASTPHQPGDLFIDIGANLGVYSLLARRLGYQTLVFEPEPVHADYLTRNAVAYGTVCPVALSDQSSVADFFVAGDDNPGSSSLVNSSRGWNGSGYVAKTQVRVERFDRMLSELAIDAGRIRFIKIDVEGNEFQTISGFTGFLAAGHRPLIWCEVRGPTSDRNPDSWRGVTDYLAKFGYLPFQFHDQSFVPFDPNSAPIPQVFDLAFRVVE